MNENKNDFAKLSLSASMLGNLEQLGYLQMTAIQAASLPVTLAGKDLIAQIQETLAGFAHQRDGLSIIRFDHVTTRKAGQRRFVDLHMHMPASWSLGRAAALRSSVEQALMSSVPGLRASIQLLPSDVEAHFDSERDLL